MAQVKFSKLTPRIMQNLQTKTLAKVTWRGPITNILDRVVKPINTDKVRVPLAIKLEALKLQAEINKALRTLPVKMPAGLKASREAATKFDSAAAFKAIMNYADGELGKLNKRAAPSSLGDITVIAPPKSFKAGEILPPITPSSPNFGKPPAEAIAPPPSQAVQASLAKLQKTLASQADDANQFLSSLNDKIIEAQDIYVAAQRYVDEIEKSIKCITGNQNRLLEAERALAKAKDNRARAIINFRSAGESLNFFIASLQSLADRFQNVSNDARQRLKKVNEQLAALPEIETTESEAANKMFEEIVSTLGKKIPDVSTQEQEEALLAIRKINLNSLAPAALEKLNEVLEAFIKNKDNVVLLDLARESKKRVVNILEKYRSQGGILSVS